ncbi:hypothetical protein EDB83DRAFT_2532609 [Lactarius deliciosus]|nr:hypothetical protein EDB83DRAFT_2532609 [Lactarius deliciosus]
MSSEIYARLCRKMMEQISPKVQDDGIKNSEGEPFAGGNLFRKYLLNRCQEDFERGWAAAAQVQGTKKAGEITKGGEESELYSNEPFCRGQSTGKTSRIGPSPGAPRRILLAHAGIDGEQNVNARMVFVLQDVIELRERKWIPRNAIAAPTMIAQVHEPAAQEKIAAMRQNVDLNLNDLILDDLIDVTR